MLNYTEKIQNTCTQILTVWERMRIENCGLPSSPRTIAVSWQSYLLLRGANVAGVKCMSLHLLQADAVVAVVSW
jgi:hypothetical protein